MVKKTAIKQRIIYSNQIKKQTVTDIESGKCSVSQAQRELSVSNQTIYNWIYRYSRYLHKNKVLVVEEKSEAYRSKELEKKIKDLEAALGRKQLEVEILNKIIDLAGDEYKADLKKNFSDQPSSGSGSTKDSSTDTP
jgi:transposase-like protein